MNKYQESRQEVAQSVHETINEISTRYRDWIAKTHPNYKADRDALNATIEKAILDGEKPAKEEARETLNKLNKHFYRSTRSKFNYLIKSISAKNGRREAFIRIVAGWPRAERRTISIKENI